MDKKRKYTSDIEKLEKRIRHLEEINKLSLDTVDLVLSLSDFQDEIKADRSSDCILKETAIQLKKIVAFQNIGFLKVDDVDSDFYLHFSDAKEGENSLLKEINKNIANGNFAWALKKSLPIKIPLTSGDGVFLLHNISTSSKILGMFVGILGDDKQKMDEMKEKMLSLILRNCAYALENSNLYQSIHKQNGILENAIRTRTHALKKSLEQQEQQVKEKNYLLGSLHSQVKIPFNASFSTVKKLKKSKLSSSQQKMMESIEGSHQSVLNILDDILTFSKNISENHDNAEIPFKVLDFIESLISSYAEKSKEKKISLSSQVSYNVAPVLIGDELKLKEILTKLLDNAMDYTEKGEINITVNSHELRRDTKLVRFDVTDTGIGIPDQLQTEIFKPFETIDYKKRKGLGLTIAKKIAHELHGTLDVISLPDMGSTFSLVIPFNKTEPSIQWSLMPFEKLIHRGIIINCSECTSNLIQYHLGELNIKSKIAFDLEEGLNLIENSMGKKSPYSFAFIDMTSLNLNLKELISTIHKIHPKITIVPIGFLDDFSKSKKDKDIDVFIKPFKQSNLILFFNKYFNSLKIYKNMTSEMKKIFVFDDNNMNLKIMTYLLQSLGYSAIVSNDFDEALAWCKKTKDIKAIFIDIVLPKKSGYEFAMELSDLEMFKNTPLIAMTSKDYDEEKCFEAGIKYYMPKPVELSSLESLLSFLFE